MGLQKAARIVRLAGIVACCAVVSLGCSVASYRTPGGAADLRAITEGDIKERFATRPAASFPARMVVVRVQAPDYRSYASRGYGTGRFSVVTTRDIEKEEHFRKLSSLPQVSAVATVNRLLLPQWLDSVGDLRLGAASLHADLLLVYTLDTGFRIKDQDLGPLSLITLGFLPENTAIVTTTASAVLLDVRTGHVYGLTEGTHTTSQIASAWSTQQAIDNCRIETEKKAFDKLIDAFAKAWTDVLAEYGPAAATQPHGQASAF